MKLGGNSAGVMCSETVETFFENCMTPERLAEVLESGIKFFLFQRGQIAAPYDSLERACAALTSELKANEEEVGSCTTGSKRELVFNELQSGIERIAAMRSQRKAQQVTAKLANKLKLLSGTEKKIRGVWDQVFILLRSILVQIPTDSLHAVALLFGASIHNPKEMVIFETSPELMNASASVGSFQTHLRNFLKNIILSSQFLDFTDKPLRSTGCHVCVWMNTPVGSAELSNQLIRLEAFDDYFVRSLDVSKLSRNIQTRKVFNIKLLSNPVKSVGVKDNVRGSSDSDIVCTKIPELICYQLPFRFRGIPASKSKDA